MILRLTTCHENALPPFGERLARDGAFTSRRGSGEGARVCYFHGSCTCPSAHGHPESVKCHSEPFAVILSAAKDLALGCSG